ncbi:MAG: periplasmic heavy metal sensor [Rhodospirillales bacterium]|nr:periplasmic heavy metal sensor [Rhodospirillales bacterium]
MSALSPKRLSVLLFISLAANLFLGGLLIGSDMRHWIGGPAYFDGKGPGHNREPGKMGGPRGLMGMHRVLGPEGQKAAREVMAGHREDMHPRFRAMRDAHRKVRDALMAEPFDINELQTAFATLRARGVETQTAVHETMIALAEQLDPSDRRNMAEHMPGAFGRHHRSSRNFTVPPPPDVPAAQ